LWWRSTWQWDDWVRMEPLLGFFRRALSRPRAVTFSPHSALAVCASHAPLSACRAWPATCSRRLGREGLVLRAPRRPAGTTPVELAAPRVRRARSARRLGDQSNDTRSWCGSRRRARDGRAREPQPIRAGLDDSSHRLLLKRSVAAALPAGPFAGGIMRRAPNFWSNLFPPIQGPKASIPWARPHGVGSHRGRRLRRRKASCFLRGEASLGQPCSPLG
jgi:hypothetical protein